ncbi:MAG TPA: SDR family oxidoreductase [Gemmatimonadaceae bacterium]|nr:SDR family oxidoreductase [Gemmatimonadaceae bacterium]
MPTNSMQLDLTGRTALVTGSTRGIGRAIAWAMARAGAHVVVSSRKADAVESTLLAMREAGLSASGFAANVGRPDEARALLAHVLEDAGGIDILVNNAGVNPVHGPVASMTPEAFDKIFAVNVKAAWSIAVGALPSLKARGGGSVINVSSIAGLAAEADLGVYSASKSALIMMTRAMAREWGPEGVRVNAICPGYIKTDFSAALWHDEKFAQRVIEATPLRRIGTPDDVAGLAVFLASDLAAFCTGGAYLVDGGYLA